MATFLDKIGRYAYRRRWLVVAVWLGLLAFLGGGAATLAGSMSNSFSIPGTQAQQAIDQLAARFPQAHAGGASARVVFVAPSGATLTTPDHQAAVERTIEALTVAPKVAAVTDPYLTRSLSPDGRYAIAQVSYAVPATELTAHDQTALTRGLAAGRAAGLTVEVGGDALRTTPHAGATEVLGVLVAALVLFITLGSLVAAGLPLLTAIASVGVGLSGIAIASRFVDINANSLILALMLGLAVGIDYALFIVSRFRHEVLVRGAGPEAAGRAVGTAGSAVVFAGLTVIIALAGLSVVGIPLLSSMGLAAAGAVAVAVLVAVTLLPALLGVMGRRVGSGRAAPDSDDAPTPTGERWARLVTRFRVPVLLIALAALMTAATVTTKLRLGLPDDSTAGVSTTQRKAYELIREGFGPGFNGPLTVVITGGDNTEAAAAAATTALTGLPGVAALAPPMLSSDGTTALLTVIAASAPNDQATTDLVHAIREGHAALRQTTGAEFAVTGQTALNVDISDQIGGALLPYLALVVGLAFLLLMLVFRSVLVPVTATLGFLLSIGATFGAVVAVFQWGWLADVFGVTGTGPIMSLLPVLLIGVLFGLAMDYQVFLVSRMREDYLHGASPQQAVTTGMRHGARVVTAAAIIMASVFGGFVIADEPLITSIGFALALGVLIDAFVVRMTIVPAVLSLLNLSAWWLPRWLDRILPKLDRPAPAAEPSTTDQAPPEPATSAAAGTSAKPGHNGTNRAASAMTHGGARV